MKKSLVLILFILAIIAGCNTSNDNYLTNEANLIIRLTDDPALYEEVLIDIQSLEVYYSTDTETDEVIYFSDINYGVYNLLDYRDGLDTLLAELTVPPGFITQVRLVLGKHNVVNEDGIYYELLTPSSQQSGLKIDVNAEIQEGVIFELWFDFDAASSVVELETGIYILKPVITAYTDLPVETLDD